MRLFQIKAFMAVTAWNLALNAACQTTDTESSPSSGSCYGQAETVKTLWRRLSTNSKIYCPQSPEFDRATARWSALEAPKVNIVVVPGTEEDVAETIRVANQYCLPFLAFNGAHGSTTTLGRMDSGIEIYLEQLNTVEIAHDGNSAKIGGGVGSKKMIDVLWAAGKQTVTGACECVSYLGPALGGGHGWLQGRRGLMVDQWLSLNIVLADGTLQTIDGQSELMWALKGAGHNFGIVTSVTTKIYDVEHPDWAIETFVFSGDKVEQVYQVANDKLTNNGAQAVDVIHWSYWLNNPEADPEKPIILFYLIQEGVKSVDRALSKPLRDLGPLSVTPDSGNYLDLAAWTGISLEQPPCQKTGSANPRFPIYLQTFDIPAVKKTYDVYADAIKGGSPFNNSLFIIESYSTQGVRTIDSESTAFAFRDANILAAPLISYAPTGPRIIDEAARLGIRLREILHRASGRRELRAYVNYSYGTESQMQLYGDERWRQQRLRALKRKYDPKGKFSFYAPIGPAPR